MVRSLFFVSILSLFSGTVTAMVHTEKLSDHIYEAGNGSIIMYEEPRFAKAAKVGKIMCVAGAGVFVGGVCLFRPELVALGMVSGFSGFVLTFDDLVKRVKKMIWGNMIALGNEGIYHWSHGFLKWEDIEDITVKEKTAYRTAGMTMHHKNMDMSNSFGAMKPHTVTTLCLKTKDKSDGSGYTGWIRSKLSNPDFEIILRNVPMGKAAFIDLVKKYWNENKE